MNPFLIVSGLLNIVGGIVILYLLKSVRDNRPPF